MTTTIITTYTESDRLAALAEHGRIWNLACAHDKIDPISGFPVFSEDNPHVEALNAAAINLQRISKAVFGA